MTEQELKEEIAHKIYVPIYNNPSLLKHQSGLSQLTREIADRIFSLIDGQRCEWTLNGDTWITQCGAEIPDEDTYLKHPFCQACGLKIEVKDGQG